MSKDRYLFKAKRIDNGEWVKGSYLYDYGRNIHYIFANEIVCPNCINDCRKEFSLQDYEVDPSTICQCTGLKDKNGNLIWENDILHNGNYFIVKWNVPCARFDIVLNNSHNIPMCEWEPMICDWKTNDFKEYKKAVDYEVIGNIVDNPELLESEG